MGKRKTQGEGVELAAKAGEPLDVTEPLSDALDRCEVAVLTGETVEHGRQKLLPIIRTDAGGFFGFGERDGPQLDNFEGRFAQLLPPKRPSAEDSELPGNTRSEPEKAVKRRVRLSRLRSE